MVVVETSWEMHGRCMGDAWEVCGRCVAHLVGELVGGAAQVVAACGEEAPGLEPHRAATEVIVPGVERA